jgi:hypothetical protein
VYERFNKFGPSEAGPDPNETHPWVGPFSTLPSVTVTNGFCWSPGALRPGRQDGYHNQPTQHCRRRRARAIYAAGLVMATALLVLKYFRAGHDLVAGGFVFAVGEAALMSGTAGGPAGSVPSVVAGTALLGDCASARQHSESSPDHRSRPWHGERDALCYRSGKNFLGRAAATDLSAITALCLPFPCHDLGQLDLEPLARMHVVKRGSSRSVTTT